MIINVANKEIIISQEVKSVFRSMKPFAAYYCTMGDVWNVSESKISSSAVSISFS